MYTYNQAATVGFAQSKGFFKRYFYSDTPILCRKCLVPVKVCSDWQPGKHVRCDSVPFSKSDINVIKCV